MEWKILKEKAKPIFKYYIDLSKNGVPKSQMNYYKKAEIEKDLLDTNRTEKVWLY